MILRYDYLRRYPPVFLQMTGLRLHEFVDLVADVCPRFTAAQQWLLHRAERRWAPGAGRHAALSTLT